jgi:hypothetical protein
MAKHAAKKKLARARWFSTITSPVRTYDIIDSAGIAKKKQAADASHLTAVRANGLFGSGVMASPPALAVEAQ